MIRYLYPLPQTPLVQELAASLALAQQTLWHVGRSTTDPVLQQLVPMVIERSQKALDAYRQEVTTQERQEA